MATVNPKIFYYCYDHNRPTGGEKHSYQHVDVLNRNGFEAYAFHRKPGFRLSWFENDTSVVDAETFLRVYNPEKDVLVFPEDLGKEILEYPVRKVIFNKNLFYGFSSLGINEPDPYVDPQTIAVLAVSEHNALHLRFAYPSLDIFRVYAHIREDIFEFRPLAAKKRQIACVPKSLPMLLTLYHMFRARASAGLNRGQQWTWEWLSDRTQREVARSLQESSVFIFTSVEEGLARLPIEAMACGCLVAAFRGGPLDEVIPPGEGFVYGNLFEMLTWLEQVVEDVPANMARYESVIATGRKMASQFSQARQAESVCRAWENILCKL